MGKKTVLASQTEQIQLILPEHLNPAGRLFGGRLLMWIDIVAAVTARRHAECNVTTAAIDFLEFQSGAYVNDTLVLRGFVTYTGNTSMEVCVETYVEDILGNRRMINRAFLIMVAIDREQNPVSVPQLLLCTQEEKNRWEAAKNRRMLRKTRQEPRA